MDGTFEDLALKPSGLNFVTAAFVFRNTLYMLPMAASVHAMCFHYRFDNGGEPRLIDIPRLLFVRALRFYDVYSTKW